MEPVPYRGSLALNFARGRGLPAESMRTWMRAAGRYLPPGFAPILDLGAGSGRFSRALADQFGVPVLAVEPSAEMRQRYRRAFTRPVHLVGGRAEELPCADGSVKAVWASQVIHHIADAGACAAQLRRVLWPSGRLLIRGGFEDVERIPPLHRYFPALRRMATEGASALSSMRAALARVGLRELAHEVVGQVSAASLVEFYDQARLRARSPLLRLTDEEFADGLARLRAAVAAGETDGPVIDQVDLVVFGAG